MAFAFPGFLFALFAISIPVIIHLFRFRKFRTVYFPNIAFLRQLSEASDKESRIKHLLVLLIRIMAIALLVMAFARPYIPAGDDEMGPGVNTVGVYIDNSFSMNALSEQGRLLDEARSRALEIAAMYGPADNFLLLTNDFEGRHQRLVSREEFINMIYEVTLSARVRTIKEVMIRKQELLSLEPQINQRAYYISDFQKSTSGLDQLDFEPRPPAYLIHLQARQRDNVFVDSLWLESPVILGGQPVIMNVRIRNDGSQLLENQAIRLFVEGQQRTVASYRIEPWGEKIIELTWPAGSQSYQQGHVEISDYPVTFDDRLYFSYAVTSEIPVLGLEGSGRNPYLFALFGRDALFNYTSMPAFNIDYSAFPLQRLIVLDAFDRIPGGLIAGLQSFVKDGGSLVVFPGKQSDIASYNDLFRGLGVDAYARLDTTGMRVSSLNELHPLFEGVFEHIPDNIDLPVASKYYAISRPLGSMGEDLLQFLNGLPFFASYPSDAGQVFVSAVPLDNSFSNFQRHSLFVPIMANIALHSGYIQPVYHTVGTGQPLVLPLRESPSDRIYSLRKDEFDVIPGQRHSGRRMQFFFHDQIEEDGHYNLFFGEEKIAALSFNYDRRESWLEAHTTDALEELLANRGLSSVQVVDAGEKPLDRVIMELGMGKQLWRLFLMLALVFLLIEVFILRFWK